MQAIDLKMDEIIEFQPELGKVLLKGSRALIINSESLAILRKDLITNLGFERAKSFMIRWGWNCGYNDALNIKEQFNWDDDLEWIAAGPVLHTLEGHTRTIVEKLEIDRQKKTFLLQGEFLNSFEAEHHLRYLGISENEVCWHLIGYAGGYGTAFLGEPVYYKETSCCGKGDPKCTFIGKSLAEWGKEIESELKYYQENTIGEELETAHQRIQVQNQQLQRAFQVHKELTDLVLKGEGIGGITQTLAKILDAKVYLLDENLVAFSNAQSKDPVVDDPLQNAIATLIKRQIEDEKAAVVESLSIVTTSKTFTQQVGEALWSIMLVPITAGVEVYGYLAVARDSEKKGYAQDLIMTIERAATVYAVEFLKQKAVQDLEQQLQGDFLDSLLKNPITNQHSLVAWGMRLGHNISKNHFVLAVGLDSLASLRPNSVEQSLELKNRLLDAVSALLKEIFPSVISVYKNEKIIILLPSNNQSKPDIYNLCSSVKEKIEQRFNWVRLWFGVGKLTSSPADYYASYEQAVETVRLAKKFSGREHIHFFEDLGPIAVLLETNNKTGLETYMFSKLGPLLDYDKKNRTNLIQTLSDYLETDSIREAALKGNISLSGYKYRLNKLKEFGYDLQSSSQRFELQLALKIQSIL